MRSRYLFVLFACLLVHPSPFRAEQHYSYYVSPTGDNANPGTEAQPFKTIQKARDVIRTQNQNMSRDITVYLRGGRYELDETLLFEPRDSGSNGHKVIYRNYQGETPTLFGGRRITGWERDSGDRWKARTDVANFRQLYVGGKRAVRARGGFLPGAELYGPGYKTSAGAMADWKNQSDVEFVYDKEWDRTICKVARIRREGDSAVVAMQQPYFTLARLKEGVRVSLPTYVENAFELLDEPGEWYLDRAAHVVYYIPKMGENLETAEVVVPMVEKLLELRGTLDAPVQNLVFEGIRFCCASWLRPSQIGHVDIQANFIITPQNLIASAETEAVMNVHYENSKSPSNVVLHAAKSVRFEDCTFTRFGSGGIDLEYGSQDNVIEGCRFFDLAGSAIQVGDVIDHHPQDSREIVKGNRIANNYIHDVAVEYKGGVGIFAGYTDGTVIAHNEISNLPYSGISIGWGWGMEDAGGGNPFYFQPFYYKEPTPSRNVICEHNHIHNVMLERNDGGGIYTLGNMPGSVIRGNLIHDNGTTPGGIYLDEGSGYIEVTGNVVYNVVRAMNYNNRPQNRIATCHEHDNYFDIKPGETHFPKEAAGKAGLEPRFRNLLAAEPEP